MSETVTAPVTQTQMTFEDPQLTTPSEQTLQQPPVQPLPTAIQDPTTASYAEEDQVSIFSV